MYLFIFNYIYSSYFLYLILCVLRFVVDKRRGLILSNRHVVSPGPILAKAVFSDYEEVTLYPVYRDPVHDFGFFRFDASSELRYMQCEEIKLCPDGAKIGAEIRVVGNDAGKLFE
jgi:S1-C subfamily serine protease